MYRASHIFQPNRTIFIELPGSVLHCRTIVDLFRPLLFDESSVRFEAPDTAIIVAAGRISPETIRQISMAVIEHARGEPYFLRLLDLSRLEGISTESRRATEQSGVIDAGRGMALFGGSLPLRIIASSVLRLKRLLTGHLSLDPVRSFDTEAEARNWIVKRRREVRRELSLPDLSDRPGRRDSAPH